MTAGFERALNPCDRRLPPASRWERFLWRIGWYRVGGPRMVPRLYHICSCGWPMVSHDSAKPKANPYCSCTVKHEDGWLCMEAMTGARERPKDA